VLLHKTLRSSTLKLAFIYLFVFCAAIFALLAYVYTTTAAYLDRRLDREIASQQQLFVEAYDRGGPDALSRLIRQRTDDGFFRDWVFLAVDDKSSYLAGNLRRWPAALPGGGWGKLRLPELATRPSRPPPVFRIAYQVMPDASRLLVGRNASGVQMLGGRIATALAIAAALFLALAAAAGISTSRRSVARIEAINAISRKIMQSGLGERIPLRGTRDEWDELAANLNSMLARIEELADSARQIADNVAHDLRTPLTRLRGRLERALTRPPDAAEDRRLIGDAIAELDAILATFASLLRISRIEMPDRRAAFHRLDLAEIAREVVDLFDPTAEDEGVRLHLCAAGAVPVIGDRDLLFDALSNIIDNAIKHGSGEVSVAVEDGDGGPAISVADRGPGIPPEERAHVLRRFYRLERSRNSPGNGLGLSLVAAVAHLHDARLDMADNAPGLRLDLRFPAPDAAPAPGD
jgi:signal transduction histidine kinase